MLYIFDVCEGSALDAAVGVDVKEEDSAGLGLGFGDDVGENGVLGRPGEGGDGSNAETRLGHHLDLGQGEAMSECLVNVQ